MNNEKSIKDLQNEIIKQIKQIESAAQLFIIQKFLKNLWKVYLVAYIIKN